MLPWKYLSTGAKLRNKRLVFHNEPLQVSELRGPLLQRAAGAVRPDDGAQAHDSPALALRYPRGA